MTDGQRIARWKNGCPPEHRRVREIADKLAFKHHMTENSTKPLPSFRLQKELVDFFDTHDLGDYWERLPEAHFNVDIRRRTHLFALDEDLAARLSELARARRVPSTVLLNSWLRERVLAPA